MLVPWWRAPRRVSADLSGALQRWAAPWLKPFKTPALVALALFAVFAGCDDWKPPAAAPGGGDPRLPRRPDARAPASEGARRRDERAVSAFAALRDRILDHRLADDPSMGRIAGLHAYDGKVADYAAPGHRRAGSSGVEKERAELAAVDPDHDGGSPQTPGPLTADEALDLALLLQRADMTLFHGQGPGGLPLARRKPTSELFSVNVYLDRDYAPVLGASALSASSPTRRPRSPRCPTSPRTW